MIFKVRKHRSKRHLRNLVRYLLSRKGNSSERVLRHESLNALPMLPGDSPASYAKQWAAALWSFTTQERRGKKPPEDYFVHSVMSFFPGNAEHAADQLTAEQAIALAKEAMSEVAPGERQVLYVAHGDKAHLHVHIAFSVVERGGRIWNSRHDFRLWESAAARLEVKYGLYQVTIGRPGGEPVLKKSPTGNELNMTIRTGTPSERMLLQELVAAALSGKPSFPTFWHRLLDAGVTPIPSIATTGRVSGISFQYEQGLPMKGSDLGKGYSWPALAKQLNFAASQHLHLVKPFAQARESVGGELHADSGEEALPITTPATGKPVLAKFIAKPVDEQRTNWVWRNKPRRIAFVERPKVYLACSGHQLVHEAIAERAKQRGIKNMAVTGSNDFRKRMWFELSLREIAVAGYQPTEKEQQGLEWWKNEQIKAGRADCSAGAGESDGDAGIGAVSEARRDAPSKSVNERGIGAGDVSPASGNDLIGVGKPSAAPGNAVADGQRNSADEGGEERDASSDGGAQVRSGAIKVVAGGQGSELIPTPYLKRASRLGDAASLRHSVHSVRENENWHLLMDMLSGLSRGFTRWKVTFGIPGQPPLGELTRRDQILPSWPNLQVLNSQGCNVELSLTSTDSWLHLVGVTERDLKWLQEQEITPAIRFTRGGVMEMFVHVNYGIESNQVMQHLAEQIQSGLDATVRAHFGSVSCPLPGFDCWVDEQLQSCCGISLDSQSIGTQLSSQLKTLKGDVGRSRVLGVPPILSTDILLSGDERPLIERQGQIEPPRPGEY